MLDDKFIEETVQQGKFNGGRTAASNHMLSLLINYLYHENAKGYNVPSLNKYTDFIP